MKWPTHLYLRPRPENQRRGANSTHHERVVLLLDLVVEEALCERDAGQPECLVGVFAQPPREVEHEHRRRLRKVGELRIVEQETLPPLTPLPPFAAPRQTVLVETTTVLAVRVLPLGFVRGLELNGDNVEFSQQRQIACS